MRGPVEESEYKHVVLGLIFLKVTLDGGGPAWVTVLKPSSRSSETTCFHVAWPWRRASRRDARRTSSAIASRGPFLANGGDVFPL